MIPLILGNPHVYRFDGSTAIHVASTHGHHEVVRLLLEARADADLADQ